MIKKLFITILFLLPLGVFAVAPAVINNTFKDAPSGTTTSFNHTVSTLDNTLIFVTWATGAGSTQPITATWGGDSLTCYDWNDVNTVTGRYQSRCHGTASTTGTRTMTVNWGATGTAGITALSIKGVNTSDIFDRHSVVKGGAATTTLTSTFANASTTQFADSLIIKQNDLSVGTGITQGSNETIWTDAVVWGTNKFQSVTTKVATTTGAYTMNTNWTGENAADQVAVAIRAFVEAAVAPVISEIGGFFE